MTSRFTDAEIAAFEARLYQLKSTLTQSSQALIEEMMEDDTQGGDSLERSTFEQRKSTDLRLKDREFKQLREINDALHRLTTDQFGVCLECGEEIPKRRLEVNPTAELCVECQESFDEEERRQWVRPGLMDEYRRF